jgi:hypothetical protein
MPCPIGGVHVIGQTNAIFWKLPVDVPTAVGFVNITICLTAK